MSMGRWLSAVLGLILVALVVAYAMVSRQARQAERLAPADPASPSPEPQSPDEQGAPGLVRRRILPHVPADPGIVAPAMEANEPVPDGAAAAPPIVNSPEAAERDQQLQRLRASGPDVAGLTGKVQSMQSEWQMLAAKGRIDVQVSPPECYHAGCFSTLVFKSRDGIEDLTSKIFDSKPVADWPGPKTRSAPLARSDGGAEVTWLLLAPVDPSASAALN